MKSNSKYSQTQINNVFNNFYEHAVHIQEGGQFYK